MILPGLSESATSTPPLVERAGSCSTPLPQDYKIGKRYSDLCIVAPTCVCVTRTVPRTNHTLNLHVRDLSHDNIEVDVNITNREMLTLQYFREYYLFDVLSIEVQIGVDYMEKSKAGEGAVIPAVALMKPGCI